jgi:hypothetical protein
MCVPPYFYTPIFIGIIFIAIGLFLNFYDPIEKIESGISSCLITIVFGFSLLWVIAISLRIVYIIIQGTCI